MTHWSRSGGYEVGLGSERQSGPLTAQVMDLASAAGVRRGLITDETSVGILAEYAKGADR